MKVYIAGPMSNGGTLTPAQEGANIRAGMEAARRVLEAGHSVYLPHLWRFFADTVEHGVTRDQWLAQDLEWVAASDAVVRLEGTSPGADREVQHAVQHGRMVLAGVDEFFAWVEEGCPQ